MHNTLHGIHLPPSPTSVNVATALVRARRHASTEQRLQTLIMLISASAVGLDIISFLTCELGTPNLLKETTVRYTQLGITGGVLLMTLGSGVVSILRCRAGSRVTPVEIPWSSEVYRSQDTASLASTLQHLPTLLFVALLCCTLAGQLWDSLPDTDRCAPLGRPNYFHSVILTVTGGSAYFLKKLGTMHLSLLDYKITANRASDVAAREQQLFY